MIKFDWDAENILHIAQHNVTPDEVEYVLDNPTLDIHYEIVNGEERFSEVGMTREGRLLLVVMTLRGDRTRPITAYDAPKFAVKAYLQGR